MISRLFLVMSVLILGILYVGMTAGLIIGGVAAAITAGLWFQETRDRYKADIEAFLCLVDGDIENLAPYYKNVIKEVAPRK